MKLIVENNNCGIYAYVESEKNFKFLEPARAKDGLVRRDASELDDECNLEHFPNSYFVFNITKRKARSLRSG